MAETCITEASVVLAYHAAATSADTGKTSIVEGAAEAVVFSGDMSQSALQYKSAIITAAGMWGQSAVNGLVARSATRRIRAQTRFGTRSWSRP
jgi:hypothetical protein